MNINHSVYEVLVLVQSLLSCILAAYRADFTCLWISDKPPKNQMHLRTVGIAGLFLILLAMNGTGNTASDTPSAFTNGAILAQTHTPLNIADEGGINIAFWNILMLNQPGSKFLLANELKKYKC